MKVTLEFNDWNEFLFFFTNQMKNGQTRLSFVDRAKYEKRSIDDGIDNDPFCSNLKFSFSNGYMQVLRVRDRTLEVV